MAFVKTIKEDPKVGELAVTTIKHEAFSGFFEVGSLVKIIAIDPIRGYDIEDDKGNIVREIGWVI